jgi:glycosyltransferase involved in cell wall biosynthesis
MNNAPKFSFVMGVFNPPEDLFRACLESCLEQEGVDYEIVVVNDGSTNNVLEILAEYDNRFPGVFKIVNQSNKGVGPAKMAGIANASGEYLWLVDADDRVRPNCVKSLVAACDEFGADQLVVGFEAENIKNKYVPFSPCEYVFHEVSKEYVFGRGYRAFWKRIVRKSLVQQCNVEIPLSIQEDRATTTRWVCESRKIIVTSAVVYKYLQNPESITKQKFFAPQFMEASLRTLELLREHAISYPQYRKWLVLEIYKCAWANLKRISDSKKMPQGRCSEMIVMFDEVERKYRDWLAELPEADKDLVYVYDDARAKLLKGIKGLRGEVKRLSDECKALKQQLKLVKKSKSYRYTKPLRLLAKFLRQIVGR